MTISTPRHIEHSIIYTFILHLGLYNTRYKYTVNQLGFRNLIWGQSVLYSTEQQYTCLVL